MSGNKTPTNIKKKLQQMTGVVTVRINKTEEILQFQVKIDKYTDEDRIDNFAETKLGLH